MKYQSSRCDWGLLVGLVIVCIHISLSILIHIHIGVNYKVGDVREKKIFAILFITFARNFNALDYINEVFLKEPTGHDQRKITQYNEMCLIWKKILRFVAFDNLCLNESIVGKPEDYEDDPGGVLGVDSLLNIFQVCFVY